jgi:hypothetical protein
MINPFNLMFHRFYFTTKDKDPLGRSRQFLAMMKLLGYLVLNVISVSYIIASVGYYYFVWPFVEVLKALISSLCLIILGYSFWKVMYADNYKIILAQFSHLSKSDRSKHANITSVYIIATFAFLVIAVIVMVYFVKK